MKGRKRIYYKIGSYGQPVKPASRWTALLCRLGLKKSRRIKETGHVDHR